METFLREHSVGSIIRSSFRIFSKHYPILFVVYTLPTFPAVVLQQEAQHAGNIELMLVGVFFNILLGFFAFAAITVAISDICLGDRPSVIRAYRRILGPTAWKLLWSNLLQMFAIGAGMLLLIVPGLVLMIRLLFTPAAVVLENQSGAAALKRSANLGKGYHWRNAGVVVVWFSITIMAYLILVLLFTAIGALLGIDIKQGFEHWGFRTGLAVLIMGLLYPLIFIGIILLYYDLRVRKEAYDVRALAEDLRR
jgi:hypothetical protein